MTAWLWDVTLLLCGFCSGAFLALLGRAWWLARLERRALRALIDQLRVVRATVDDRPEDERARRVVALWSELSSISPSVDRRLWDINCQMVIEVACAYGRELPDVRISHAAQIVSRLLSDDLGRTLSVLERYMTVHRVLQMRRYWQVYQDWSERYPALGPGLRIANSLRRWGMRAYRLIGQRIPQLLFFEAAGTAATYGAREYFASLIAELTGRVGMAAIELYSGAQVTVAEQTLVSTGMEILLLEQLAREGEPPGQLERDVIAAHAEERGCPGDRLGPIVAELSRAEALGEPVALALRLAPDELLEQSMLRLVEMCPERSSARQARQAFVSALREPLDQRVHPEPRDAAPAPELPSVPDSEEALLQRLWQDVRETSDLSTEPPRGKALLALLDSPDRFVRATDLWRLEATQEEALAYYPKLRKALWLAGAGHDEEQLPAEVQARAAAVLDAEPDQLLSSFRQRFERARNSWLSILTPTRVDRERLLRFVEDEKLVATLRPESVAATASS